MFVNLVEASRDEWMSFRMSEMMVKMRFACLKKKKKIRMRHFIEAV